MQLIAEMDGTVADKCVELGELLGLEKPVSKEVLYTGKEGKEWQRLLKSPYLGLDRR